MAECVDCLHPLKRGERGYSFCSPSGFACLCRECGERYPTVEALFARLRNEVRESPRMTPLGRQEPPYAA